MASFNFTVPDPEVPRIQDAFAANYRYQTDIPNPAFDPEQPEGPGNEPTITNPETINQFVKRQIREFIKGNVVAYEKKVQRQGLAAITPPDVTDS